MPQLCRAVGHHLDVDLSTDWQSYYQLLSLSRKITETFSTLFTSPISPISPSLSAVYVTSCFTEDREAELWDGNFLCFPPPSL